jgi:hypothetical protein
MFLLDDDDDDGYRVTDLVVVENACVVTGT